MLKALVSHLIELGEKQADLQSKVIEINGNIYSSVGFSRIKDFTAEPITIKTLSGLVDYLEKNVDGHNEALIVHVHSNHSVSVYSELRADKRRECFINCEAELPRVNLGNFMDVESFNILLQSCFVPTEHLKAVLQVVGNVKDEAVRTIGDDGVSQEVTVRKGIQKADNITVPNPVILAPFRTFGEVFQPESKFVFRMQDGPRAGLFEADGGQWKIEAMQNVKHYLEVKLEGLNVKIIS
jgi:hypothetical protein